MATLQPGEKSRMYALGGIARGGAFRGGYVSARVFVAIGGGPYVPPTEPGHVGILLDSLRIQDELDDTPNTCTFTVNGAVPPAGGEVRITLGSKNSGTPLFAGFALHVTQVYVADKPANIQAQVSAVDYTWLFGFVKVTARYRTTSATVIAQDLVGRYAAANGFTTGGIAPGLPVLDELTYTNEDLDAAMTRLARRIGGYWYVDYQKSVHLFLEETGSGAPETLTPQHKSLDDFVKTADRTQVLTRVYVEGRGTSFLGPVTAGDTMIPLDTVDMFAVAPDVFAKVSPQGSEGGAQHVTFTGVVPGGAGSLVGPGVGPPGAPTVIKYQGTGLGVGRYQYAYTDVTATGETLPSPVAAIDIGGVIPVPTVAASAQTFASATGVDVGTHYYGYTYITAAGNETTGSPASAAVVTSQPIAPTSGITGTNPLGGGSLGPAGATYGYRVTYLGDAGGETTAAAYGTTFTVDSWGHNAVQLLIGRFETATPTAAPIPAGVTHVKIYRSVSSFEVFGPPTTGPFYYLATATVSRGPIDAGAVYNDLGAALGAAIPTTNTAQAKMGLVRVVTTASPDPSVTGMRLYRTAAGGGAYRRVVQVDGNQGGATYDDTLPDASLGVTAPIVNTAGNEYRSVWGTNMAVGPPGTIGRRLYRTVVNGAQFKLVNYFVDNTTTVFHDQVPDGSLGATAPSSDTSGLQQVPGQVVAGASAMVVANAVPFESAGGWAVIGNGEQVIRYTGKTANSLTGIPPTGIGSIVAGVAYNSTVTQAPMLTGVTGVTTALVKGDEIYLVVRRVDESRRSALAAVVGGDGYRDEWVQDRRLSIGEARARGDATLALRPLEDVTVQYRCRDLRTASGKTITVNLPAPTNVFGSFKIQSVTIDHFRPYPTQYPTFTVTASSRHFNFEDWLRRMETSS